jgi:hypothetical protein
LSNDIFISYTTRDKEIVDNVLSVLNQNEISFWFAPRDINAGQKHTEVIIPAIRSAKLFMVFLSKYTRPYGENNKDISDWVKDEISVARSQGKYIIPIKLDSTVNLKTDDLLFERLGNYIDFTTNSFELATNQLIKLIKHLLVDDNYKELDSPYLEIIKEAELEQLKEIGSLIKSGSIKIATETLNNNDQLRIKYVEHIKFYETIILMSQKNLKDLDLVDVETICENLEYLQKTEFLKYALYLEALILESYFNFNCIYNNSTRDLISLKKLARTTSKIKTVDYRLFQNIKTVNNNIKIEWMKLV